MKTHMIGQRTITMYKLDPRIVFKGMHHIKNVWSKKRTVSVTVEMPLELWDRVCRLLGVDENGRVLPKSNVKPLSEGVVPTVSNTNLKIPSAQQLRWEQKNRKEKEK